ncbi:hypothetical protein HDF19_08495 [Mucilaginibacter sp. E4BP6]|uniref:hypothetical protein n=1 Tax=Mucilaginibacter sp. E4BP6 TaxID=2723089 RepID=UPI0015CBAA17|nr:hypothetical protein [Mucilaginibacter sp. E4BP6]NYE68566.1 hypothetical protein [Mucilaginibacter sp. E4BP6]
MKNKKIIKRLILCIFLLIIFFVLAKPIYTVITNQETLSKNEFSDYKNLFNKQAQSNLKLFNTIQSKSREPESQYIYDNDYNIFLTKVHISNSFNFKKDISVQNIMPDIKTDEVYFPICSFIGKIDLKSISISLVKEIRIDFNGQNLSVDTTQNQVSYYFDFKSFSLTLNNTQPYIIAKTEKAKCPAAIAFVRKGEFLYVALMTLANSNKQLSHDQLYNILNK